MKIAFRALQAGLGAYDELHGLLASHGDIAGDLFVSPDAEGSDSVPGLAKDWLLPCQLFQHLWSIARQLWIRLLDARDLI